MFNIAFPELLVICLVVLIVVGPDKLPKIVHAAGLFVGRMQRYVSDIKSEMHEEMRLKDLQRLQEELRQNVNNGESPQYKEGDVIDHRELDRQAAASADTPDSPSPAPVRNRPEEAAVEH